MIVLDDVLKTISLLYIFSTFAHQPLIGTIYGNIGAFLEGTIKDPGIIPHDVATAIQEGNVATLKVLIEREKEQLRSEGIDIDKILENRRKQA
jgi:hypothetical protein